jgi:hypothetical protein
LGIDDICVVWDAPKVSANIEIFVYNDLMQFKTEEILREAGSLPSDECSVNNAERSFDDANDARHYYDGLRRRFTDIEQWNRNSTGADYELFERDGNKAAGGRIRPGLFIKITLHGSGKSDWVLVDNLVISPNELVITVKPTFDPTETPQQQDQVSHFFAAAARNNFCALCDGQKVRVFVIGLHETQNTDQTSGIIETIRNVAVANFGSYLGIQTAVWKAFCERFLSDEAAAE